MVDDSDFVCVHVNYFTYDIYAQFVSSTYLAIIFEVEVEIGLVLAYICKLLVHLPI